jgi:hypothetical protein
MVEYQKFSQSFQWFSLARFGYLAVRFLDTGKLVSSQLREKNHPLLSAASRYSAMSGVARMASELNMHRVPPDFAGAAVVFREKEWTMSLAVDNLMLQARTAILEENTRRFHALRAEGRVEESLQQFQATLQCAAGVLEDSLKILQQIAEKKNRMPPFGPEEQ